MILVSAGLVLTAIVLLIAGFVLGQAYLVMWSIAISLLSAVFLVIGALLRRHELFPGGHAGAAPAFPQKGPVPAGPLPAPHMMPNQTSPHPPQMMMPRGMQQTATVAAQPRLSPMARPVPAARQGPLDDGAIVLVIPGRKRYHVAGCRQLVGRDHEELTHEEAREEGFTPCTTCLPESIAGTQPQDALAGAQEPVKPLQQVASQESSSSGATREPGHHEATARFTSPYKPVASSARQESPLAGQETSAPGQETVVPPARPYAHPPAAQTPPSEPGRTHSQEPGETRPQEPTRQSRPQEPVSPPLRTGQSAVPSFSFMSPSIPEIPPAESEATSWFNRDAVAPSESGTEAPANPDPELVKPGSPAESESAERKPAEPGSPTAAEPSTRSEASARSETSAESPAAKPETPEPVKPEASGSKPVKSEDSGSQTVKAETAESESAKSETTSAKTASAKGEAPEASSEVKRKAPVVPAPTEPADDVAEPVESAETAPGRAGQPVPADLTPVESAAAESDEAVEQPAQKVAEQSAQKAREKVPFEDRDDDDTSPGGIPIIWDRPGSADPETEPDQESETEPGPKREAVKVIAGTRRFHDSDCPLIKGMGGSGVETMSQSEAEDAGLTSCPVCLSDH